MTRDNTRGPAFYRIACHIFKIEPVEMREPAVPALHRDGATADRNIMKAKNPAVPACCRNIKRPDRPGSGAGKLPSLIHVFNTGHKDPGRPAGFAGDIGPVGHRLDVLVCHLPAVVTVGAVVRADEPVAHEGWCIPGIINLSQEKARLAGHQVVRSRIHAAGTFHAPYIEGDFRICTRFCRKKGKFI
jgi:hypothetical protein